MSPLCPISQDAYEVPSSHTRVGGEESGLLRGVRGGEALIKQLNKHSLRWSVRVEGEWKGEEYTNQSTQSRCCRRQSTESGDGFGRGVIVLDRSRRSVMQGTVPGYIGVGWSERAKSTNNTR